MNEISITTTQNVNLTFTAGGVGERILACVLDFVIKFAYVTVIQYILESLNLRKIFSFDDHWSEIAIYIIIYLPVLVYTLVLESLWEGQTIGKKIMKLKVIKIDGYQASFGEYFMRWIFRLVDIFIPIVGLIVLVSSKKSQRLGDIASGTAVITTKNNINIKHTILEELSDDYVPKYPSVVKLSDNDARIIKETFQNSVSAKDYATISKLRKKINDVTGIVYDELNDTEFIRKVLKDYNFYTGK